MPYSQQADRGTESGIFKTRYSKRRESDQSRGTYRETDSSLSNVIKAVTFNQPTTDSIVVLVWVTDIKTGSQTNAFLIPSDRSLSFIVGN